MPLKAHLRFARLGIPSIATCLVAGCGPQYRNVGIGLYNATPVTIANSEVRYGDFVSHVGGILGPEYEKVESFVPQPFPPTAMVTWSSAPDGAFHRVTVPLAPVVPKDFDGDIFFRFEPDGTVSVIPVWKKDWMNNRDGPLVWESQARARGLRLSTQPASPESHPATAPGP